MLKQLNSSAARRWVHGTALRAVLAAVAAGHIGWLGILSILFIFAWQAGAEGLAAVLLWSARAAVLPLAWLCALLAIRLVNAQGTHLAAFGRHWNVRHLRRLAVALLAIAVPVSLFSFLGPIGAVGIVIMQGLTLIWIALQPRSANAAFAALAVFVLSIVSFNSLADFFTLESTPVHLVGAGAALLIQRNVLRSRPERLRVLVLLGLILALGLAAVHLILLAVNLPLVLAWEQDSSRYFGRVLGQRYYIPIGDGRDLSLFNAAYIGFNIIPGLATAGLLLLLPGRLPRRAHWMTAAAVLLLAAASAAAPFIYFEISPFAI